MGNNVEIHHILAISDPVNKNYPKKSKLGKRVAEQKDMWLKQ